MNLRTGGGLNNKPPPLKGLKIQKVGRAKSAALETISLKIDRVV